MRVWIQAGHCFRKTGSTGTAGQGTSEQAYVMSVAKRAALLLQRAGHHATVALADTFPARGYDVFVALHCDGSVSKSASGASIGYRDADGRKVGTIWKKRYAARGWPYGMRGDNYTSALARYYGTGWAASQGIKYAFILEHGFLTNPNQDGKFMVSARGRDVAAYALADTVEVLSGDSPVDGGGDEQDDDMGLPKYDDESADVEELQQALWDWAHDPDLGGWEQWLANTGMQGSDRKSWCDAKFGKQTKDAVVYFQRQNWMKDDGVVTAHMLARLEAKRYLAPLQRKLKELEAVLAEQEASQ